MDRTREFLDDLSSMFKALGDPTRLGIVLGLMEGERCVSDLASSMDISESSTSHHLRGLRQLRVVKRRREGKRLFYSLDDHHVYLILTIGLEHQAHKDREEC
ncbi:ArsR/SmtB family transcription factor [Dethiosulfovibrio salsuginis]|uniref:Transcriptional regulator, ArsR family n=1 Tax=Dethiosulfovibrio salsuginis TaxID=561720 RepID=A0A1X7L9R9_9BACT|nr:metalloregulator ArsR/SmtB family transcription factor [Dethiosulfovibrio salsuginis]SMG50588.1 transcriptional regulator, ArsR family [Dethiosulfovibrio salsuginis]